ncbi:NUDIX hydrolase [Halorussus sp. MSC15.2]|uniref:NUDIX hydrolase n=1 Tax=Halorussus sp. MSC15.2 TaxID=2283638 RepID=UPI0013D4F92C|nr:NUDIX domain-containing protein [Halorussus sp. MSC15.2]NEU56150.1 NUDIX domain-containing protein [Halorussus sp. MSC15.2]
MTGRRIRMVALGVVSRRTSDDRVTDDEQLLVERHRDPESGETFYRPLGGGVEFGERSEDALRREFREELGVELTGVSYLGTDEDVFTFDGETHHEVWRVYETDVVEDWPYEREEFTAREPETGEEIECVWKSRAALETEETFYPDGVLSEL